MGKRSEAVFVAVTLLILAGIAVFLSGGNQEGFTGSREKTPDAYLLDIEKMNGTDLHTLRLQKGDALRIGFETEKGELNMQICGPDGAAMYRGNGKETTFFTVNISEDGVYSVVVEARRAKGTIHIQRIHGTQL